jgi:small subunit ribosomal protein S18
MEGDTTNTGLRDGGWARIPDSTSTRDRGTTRLHRPRSQIGKEEEVMARYPAKNRVDAPRPKRTPLLAPDVKGIDYKDVNLLRKFISERGKIRSRANTGLTVQQQRTVAKAIKNAREMALLPYQSR